jgi:hypothetical protein
MPLKVCSHGLRTENSPLMVFVWMSPLAYSPALWLTDSCLKEPSRMPYEP